MCLSNHGTPYTHAAYCLKKQPVPCFALTIRKQFTITLRYFVYFNNKVFSAKFVVISISAVYPKFDVW